MKVLVAVKSCRRDVENGANEAIRLTWGRDIGWRGSLWFFVGRDSFTREDDEVIVDAPDDYMGLPQKTRGILRWALRRGYDFVFSCDTDTYVKPARLFNCGFENFDYTGRFGLQYDGRPFLDFRDDHGNVLPLCWPWASGGVGYFLSARAARRVVEGEPTHWAEDLWVGQVLGPAISRGELRVLNPPDFDGGMCWHLGRPDAGYGRLYNPRQMYDAYHRGSPW